MPQWLLIWFVAVVVRNHANFDIAAVKFTDFNIAAVSFTEFMMIGITVAAIGIFDLLKKDIEQ